MNLCNDIIQNYEAQIKKAKAQNKIQGEIKDKGSSKKKRTLLHFL